MFDYTICNQPDDDIFKRQCDALEKYIPCIKKGKLLIDVDGSQIQLYLLGDKSIIVYNSYYIKAVYIKSEINLAQFF